MLAIIRIIVLFLILTFISLFGLVYCLFNPRSSRNVFKLSKWLSYLSPILGIKVEVRGLKNFKIPKKCIYIANHQNNYDMITITHAIQCHTVTVGKKSLLWIPLFGQLYWLAGNFLIDRNNDIKARDTIKKIIYNIKTRNISILMFPEGTRNKCYDLLPFKTGAFYIAIITGLPIISICVSNITNKIKINRWCNGLVIIEILPIINSKLYNRGNIRYLTHYCHNIMKDKINQLNLEVKKREAKGFLKIN